MICFTCFFKILGETSLNLEKKDKQQTLMGKLFLTKGLQRILSTKFWQFFIRIYRLHNWHLVGQVGTHSHFGLKNVESCISFPGRWLKFNWEQRKGQQPFERNSSFFLIQIAIWKRNEFFLQNEKFRRRRDPAKSDEEVQQVGLQICQLKKFSSDRVRAFFHIVTKTICCCTLFHFTKRKIKSVLTLKGQSLVKYFLLFCYEF